MILGGSKQPSKEWMDEGRHRPDTEVRVMEDFRDAVDPIYRSSTPKIWTATPPHPQRIVLRERYPELCFSCGGSGVVTGSKHISDFRLQAGGL